MAGDGPSGAAEGHGPSPATTPAVAQVFVDDLTDPALDPDDAHHLARVLRVERGEIVLAADGRGAWRPCHFVPGARPVLVPGGEVVHCPRPDPPVTVAFVPVKGDRPEWVVQKLTEIGVDRVVVLRSQRSVVRWDREPAQADRALARLRRVAVAAAAQSRRAWLPEIEGITALDALAAGVAPGTMGLAERGGDPPGLHRPVVAVGPEGGWSDDELAGTGLPLVGLGPTVLRAETATVALGTLLCALRSGVVRAGAAGPA